LKRGGPDHPKTFALAEALGIRRPYAIGLLELLFHFTAQYAPQGDIGRYSDKRIAAALDWQGSVPKLIHSLVGAGWLDRDRSGALFVHDWSDHADRTTLQRLSRAGKSTIQLNVELASKLCTQSETNNRTPPEPEPYIAIAIARAAPVPLTNGQSPSGRFAEWWARYPLKNGENLCAQLWVSVVTAENESLVFSCLDRYLASEQVSRGVLKRPNNWLHDCSRDNWKSDWPPAVKNGYGDRNLPPATKPDRPSESDERDALEWLAINDADPTVREDARKRLEGK